MLFPHILSLIHAEYSLTRPTPWQRGFWIDPIEPGLVYIGLGIAVLTYRDVMR